MSALRFCDRPQRAMRVDPKTGFYDVISCELCDVNAAEDGEFLCAGCLGDEKAAIAAGEPSLLTRPYRDRGEYDGAMRMVRGEMFISPQSEGGAS